uniref:Uncharacterized protein n=1 Tax=Rhizophora mucronata TaxID=61149 RepID=A0A2P2Q253_RHIMU
MSYIKNALVTKYYNNIIMTKKYMRGNVSKG